MEKVIDLLRETDAMLEGHFLLSSGRHSDKYFQCAKLLQYPQKAKDAFEDTVKKIKEDIKNGKLKIDVVAGPAMGGIIAAWEVARQLGLPSIFTERDDTGKMVLRRGFELLKGTNVLIVEDVVTTGKSSMECAAALEEAGAVITALACVVDRRARGAADIPWSFYPAAKLTAENWDAAECELCKKGIPAVKLGSRKII
ncbi:MAG: orotate phosphoribosyltransferase [Treponema sp.]|nr:orotate phosphoribosyltransferase [Treponema sp.]MCL2250949.1 orotate phosphoribosyltransferase [Treponema sp.]